LHTVQTDTYGQVQTGIGWQYKSSQFAQSLASKMKPFLSNFDI